MSHVLQARKKNIGNNIHKAYQDLEDIFGNGLTTLSFINESRDKETIENYLAELKNKPSLINQANRVNMKLIHSPYNRARMGQRDEYQILDLLKDRLELATLRIKGMIDDLNAPFGPKTEKVIMSKRNYYLRLLREKTALSWSK